MLSGSFALLSAAVALGLLLVTLVMRPSALRPSVVTRALHGGLGAAGLALLWLALRGPPRGAGQGAALFGRDAAALLTAALLAGLVILVRPRAGAIVVLHAVLAVFGYVILASYISFD